MAKIKIATFNINNLFVRYKFEKSYAGSQTIGQLDENKGYLPIYSKGSYEIFNDQQRVLAAQALTNDGTFFPDVICLQEIESLIALRFFNDKFLKSHYKHCLVVDSYDFRQIDVGILTNLEILGIRTHVDTLDPLWDGRNNLDYQSKHLFSRDCLEVELKTRSTQSITLFINHFKSKFQGVPPKSADSKTWKLKKKAGDDAKRLRQSTEVLRIIKKRFKGDLFKTKDFIVLGDFNEYPSAPSVAPLWRNSHLEDVLKRIPKPEDRWTHFWNGKVSQLDHFLVSPSITAKSKGILPVIERRAIGFNKKSASSGYLPRKVKFESRDDDPNPIDIDFQFNRFDGITDKDYASDHCPVFFQIPV